jgi:putative membrane protein
MKNNRTGTALGLCSAALLVCTGLPAGAQMMMHHVSAGDRAFMTTASEGNYDEIAAGRLAATKGGSNAVRTLGQRYADNHRTNEQQLAALASRLGVTLPMHPSYAGRMQLQQLKGLSGRAFDAAFLRDEMHDHMQAIGAFQEEARSGRSPSVVAYANTSLPVLEKHLQLATDDSGRMRAMAGSNGMNHVNANEETGANTAPGPKPMNANAMNNGMNHSNANEETGANTAPGPNSMNASGMSRNTSNQETGASTATPVPGAPNH